jgi:hypothetical protein
LDDAGVFAGAAAGFALAAGLWAGVSPAFFGGSAAKAAQTHPVAIHAIASARDARRHCSLDSVLIVGSSGWRIDSDVAWETYPDRTPLARRLAGNLTVTCLPSNRSAPGSRSKRGWNLPLPLANVNGFLRDTAMDPAFSADVRSAPLAVGAPRDLAPARRVATVTRA